MVAEAAMLTEFARWLTPETVLLSYNGKSYDRLLLTTRCTMARIPDPLLGLAHLDLLHPVRRFYRGVRGELLAGYIIEAATWSVA